jgi:hypothetical protein
MHGGMLLNKSNSKTDLCPLNISAMSWRSVLLVEEPGVPGENPHKLAKCFQYNMNVTIPSLPRVNCKSCVMIPRQHCNPPPPNP